MVWGPKKIQEVNEFRKLGPAGKQGATWLQCSTECDFSWTYWQSLSFQRFMKRGPENMMDKISEFFIFFFTRCLSGHRPRETASQDASNTGDPEKTRHTASVYASGIKYRKKIYEKTRKEPPIQDLLADQFSRPGLHHFFFSRRLQWWSVSISSKLNWGPTRTMEEHLTANGCGSCQTQPVQFLKFDQYQFCKAIVSYAIRGFEVFSFEILAGLCWLMFVPFLACFPNRTPKRVKQSIPRMPGIRQPSNCPRILQILTLEISDIPVMCSLIFPTKIP